MDVFGNVEPRFERVREEFERNFAEREEVGASVCVMVDGEPVVDLWGGVADPASGRPWERDTVSLIFSASKGVTAICANLLVARGELDLDAPVARYWPEFAQNGKEDVTVKMAFCHSAGVPVLRDPVPPGGFNDWDRTVEQLAAEPLFWEPGTRHGYHAFTIGWILGELVRRVTGRSIGTFLREEIADPLGLDVYLGVPDDVQDRVAWTNWFDPARLMDGSLGVPPPPYFVQALSDPTSIPGLLFLNNGGWLTPDCWNTRESRAATMPAANGHTNARALAGIYAPLANGGTAGGVKLFTPEDIARMGAVVRSASDVDAVILSPTRFGLGFLKSIWDPGLGNGNSFVVSESAFGHPGFGGPVGFADPQARLSFGYTMNQQGPGMWVNDKGQSLIDATYASVGYTSRASGVWI